MNISPIFPFNLCKNILERNTENRKLRIRKGDLIDVPPFEGDLLSTYFDGSNNHSNLLTIKKIFTDNTSNISFDNKTLNEKSI